MTAPTADAASAPDAAQVRRAVAAAAIGNATEWYDYGIFTSGLITVAIGTQFFPGHGNAALKSLALVAIGFIVRPLGGLFFGPLGDRVGRQRVLAATIVLMSACTFVVGCLPTYAGPYSMGIGAPLAMLLLRIIQGFCTGGEYGGAATFIAEYTPTERRGFFGSFLELGTLGGYVLGNVVVLSVTLILGTEATQDWGWRIPFLLALPLGPIGLYLRLKLGETPTFRRLVEAGGQAEKAPLKETLVNHWPAIGKLIGIVFLLSVADYMLLTTMPTYFVEHLHLDHTTATLIIIGIEGMQMLVIAPLGALSDRIGRKPLLFTAAIGFIVLSLPALNLMQSGSTILLVTGFAIVAVLLVCMLAVVGSTFPAMFPTRVRYSSFAIGYNVSVSIFGGTCGVLVEVLIDATGSPDIPAYYLMIAGVVGLVAITLLPETAGRPLEEIDDRRRVRGHQ